MPGDDAAHEQQRLGQLLEVGRSLVSELDLEAVLRRVVEVAREVTGARYGALGVLDSQRGELERFFTSGVDEAVRREIGNFPRGRGILGELIRDPRPLRLASIGDHPRSYGLPPGHPPMTTFLGAPILIRGQAYGNVYLTEKVGGEFNEDDERSLVVLAEWAAIAIDNARLYADVADRREELERAVRGLEATTAIARAVGAETRLSRVLELIVKRGRALVEARALAIFLIDDARHLRVAATAGEFDPGAMDMRLQLAGSVSERVIESGRPERLTGGDVAAQMARLAGDVRAAMIVPLVHRTRASGVLVAFDRLVRGPAFEDEDEELMQAFAASAATAVATAQTVETQRLRYSIEAAERERRRWARELHDETLQGLGALHVVLDAALQAGDPASVRSAVEQGRDQTAEEIERLQALITELRPAALDELGLRAAIESLAARTATVEGVDIDLALDELPSRLSGELESGLYRLCQEALTNIGKHAGADRVRISLTDRGQRIELQVTDDGCGFDPDAQSSGYGLMGMAERVELMHGDIEIASRADSGTSIRVSIPRGR